MNSAKLSTVSKGLYLSAALAVSFHAQAQAHADSVNVIFAAENALYGAGYDIGRADGWMDKALQQGVRDYQARNGALKVSGILDAATLSALGVSNSSGRAVSGNGAPSKTAALAALGISETQNQAKPEAIPRRRLQPKPAFSVKEIVPEPEPAPTPVAEQQPKPQVQHQSRPTKQTDPTTPEATPEVASQTSVTPPAKPVTKPSPVPKAEAAPQSADKPAPSTDLAKVKSPAPETVEPTSAETVAWMKQLPNEGTAFEKPENTIVDKPVAQAPKAEAPETATADAAQKEQPAKPDNDRNIFGSLFHFLFGWMV